MRQQENFARFLKMALFSSLPDARTFKRIVCDVLASAGEDQVAVITLDLDGVETIDEALGRRTADNLLAQAALRISTQLSEGDTLAYLGGERFSFIMRRPPGELSAESVTERIHNDLKAPYFAGQQELFVTPSSGIANYPRDGLTANKVQHSSMAALKHAKRIGGGRYSVFREETALLSRNRLNMTAHLRDAIREGNVLLCYQPQICAKTGATVGLESLARLSHPQKGIIPPQDFILLAEEVGIIGDLGACIFRGVCQQLASWMAEGVAPPRVAINISPAQLAPALPDFMQEALMEYGIAPTMIEAEITESALRPTAEIKSIIHRIKQLGISLAIDDFGTSYSCLSHLKLVPFDRLKIDRSFVTGLPSHKTDQAISKAIIAMGKAMDADVIAEGVENPAQADFLRAAGVDAMQGFLFSRPLAAEQVPGFLLALQAA